MCVVKGYADRGYRGIAGCVFSGTGGHCVLEIVGGVKGQQGFVVQPKRWIVERSLSWFCWSRRLSKDYEQTVSSSEAWMDVSAIRTTLRKITK